MIPLQLYHRLPAEEPLIGLFAKAKSPRDRIQDGPVEDVLDAYLQLRRRELATRTAEVGPLTEQLIHAVLELARCLVEARDV